MADDWTKEIPHLIVLLILLFVLLVILTKFKWIHCSQVPGWCDVYCNAFGKSKVAIVSGDSGIGDPEALRGEIINFRFYTIVDPLFPIDSLSIGLLKNYELIILDHAKRITPRQANALKAYLDQGGNMIVVGDAATEYYLTPEDLAEALQKNQSEPGYYERFLKGFNRTLGRPGFGDLGDYFFINFISTFPASPGLQFHVVNKDHVITKGIADFSLPPVSFVSVNPNRAGTTILASIKQADKEYPALIESRYVGRLLYASFPLEEVPKQTIKPGVEGGKGKVLLTNVMDYLVTC